MGKGSAQTVGYRYSMSLFMGLGRGPVDEIVEIKVGDETAWTGSVTATGETAINAADLFGGDSGEGGVAGRLQVLMGEPTQTVPSWVAALLPGLLPAFRGVVTLFFDGLICSMNPYPKAWAVRSRRATKGWRITGKKVDGTSWAPGESWYPETAFIDLNSGDT